MRSSAARIQLAHRPTLRQAARCAHSVILVRAFTCRCQGDSQGTTDNNGQNFTDRA